MRILVTGAGGFVGRHLLAFLEEDVVPLSADVTDRAALDGRLRDADAVIHLAAAASVSASWDRSAETWRVNVLGTVNVLDAVREQAPSARVLMISTGEVYGALGRPAREEDPIAPLSPYAASKAAAEVACDRARRSDGIDVVIARPFAHIGPGQDERFVVGSWAWQLARFESEGGGTLEVGDVSVERDFTDVRDICRAYRALLDGSVPAGDYIVASGTAMPLQRVLDLLVDLADVPVDIRADPRRFRKADISSLVGDATKLRAATGWRPTIPIEKTLADALDEARRGVRGQGAAAL